LTRARSRLAGDDADRAEREAVRAAHRGAGIEADPGLAGHQRIGGEAPIQLRIRHHEDLLRLDPRKVAEEVQEELIFRLSGSTYYERAVECLEMLGFPERLDDVCFSYALFAARAGRKDALELLLKKHPERYRKLFLREAHYLNTEGFHEHFRRGALKYGVQIDEFLAGVSAAGSR